MYINIDDSNDSSSENSVKQPAEQRCPSAKEVMQHTHQLH